MCGLGRPSIVILAGLMGIFQAQAALGQTADLRLFASCAGRLSALMEHQWLLSDPEAEVTAAERDAMLSLVSTMVGPEDEALALTLRVAAKAVQADLLSQARFGQDDARAARAARQSDDLIGMCRSLLLG
jgi:hypothetical protein